MKWFDPSASKKFNFKQVLFRRDAEKAYYTRKPFPLPKVTSLTEASLKKFKDKYPFNIYHSVKEMEIIGELFKSIENKDEISHKADGVINGYFDFPSRKNVYLGTETKWNLDYISGFEWSKDLSWKDNFFDFQSGTDIVNAWLLGRLNQLIYLGKGYLVTGDERYVEHYKLLLQNFMERNPFCAGVNWINTGEISIRLLNIIYSIPLVIYSPFIDENFINSVTEYILLHAVFIENNLEYELNSYSNLVSTAALAAAGLVLKESHYGSKLLHFSHARTEEAIKKMISPDGISCIRSVPYHPHVVEIFIILKFIFEKSSVKLSSLFQERYSRMFGVIASLLRDDGSIANIGDPFISRILPFSSDNSLTNKFPLAVAIPALGKGKYKDFFPSPTLDLLFYGGQDALINYYEVKKEEYTRISYGYTYSGIYVLRNNDIHITIDATDIGTGRETNGGHNDILSFELFYKGNKVIVDPGMNSVFSNIDLRNRLRSVRSHNTIFIDDEEPVMMEGLHGIKEDLTKPKVTEWHSDEYEDVLSVQHYAYARFPDPVIIKRIFRLQKEKNKLIIRDEIFGGSTHQAFSSLIFHPGINIFQTGENIFRFSAPVTGEVIFTVPSGIFSTVLLDQMYSPKPGELGNTRKIFTSLTAQFPIYMVTEIILK
jgi:hypothetical protein